MERLPVLSRLAVVLGCTTLLAGGGPSVVTSIGTGQTCTALARTASSRPAVALVQRGQDRPRYSVILV